MKPRLVVFARAPVIGGAKTRLARGIGKVSAWRLYRAMTDKTLRRTRDDRWETVLAVSPDGALKRRFSVWPRWAGRLVQGSGDLGARQQRAFNAMRPGPRPAGNLLDPGFRRGNEAWDGRGPVCVIGTDAPGVTRGDIARAFAGLKRHDAVVGPAEDGGYWLLALNAPVPRGLFDGVRWSHENTRTDLIDRLRAQGLSRILRLRALRDVDEASDLQIRLQGRASASTCTRTVTVSPTSPQPDPPRP